MFYQTLHTEQVVPMSVSQVLSINFLMKHCVGVQCFNETLDVSEKVPEISHSSPPPLFFCVVFKTEQKHYAFI